MADIQFTINPVEKKPEKKRARPKGSSKYAPIIEAFLESGHEVVKVENTGKEPYYLCGQLRKVFEKRGLDSINVVVRNKEVYLEKN